ncbi:MAG: EscU/YscU/HrcU family type III secretion system export apparatus switch protein [Bdellovibrionales bacterium]|nr:EscU/YscU/HrcU family type III secretion system export apparatus switch protein [Bdellovibrionales bacterium]
MSAAEKKHEPTQQKLERARKEGQVAKSSVFTQSFQIVGVVVGIRMADYLFWNTTKILLHYKEFCCSPDLYEWTVSWAWTVSATIFCALGFGVLGALFGEVVQVGVQVSFKPLRLDASRLDPSKGVARLGSEFTQIWLLIVKFLGAAAIAFFVISANVSHLSSLWLLPAHSVAQSASSMFCEFALLVVGFWLLLGLLERLYKRFRFLKEQRMTDEEVRRESKESEGDPHVRSQRKSLQRELAFTELATRVKRSRVVIVKRKDSR